MPPFSRTEQPWAAGSFVPLPVRWRIEATFGTLTNRYRRLTRNLEQSQDAAENLVELANLRRVLRVLNQSPQEHA
jgi:putative transposase